MSGWLEADGNFRLQLRPSGLLRTPEGPPIEGRLQAEGERTRITLRVPWPQTLALTVLAGYLSIGIIGLLVALRLGEPEPPGFRFGGGIMAVILGLLLLFMGSVEVLRRPRVRARHAQLSIERRVHRRFDN
jgi:hypothetical protein